jgi:hypothetical protein
MRTSRYIFLSLFLVSIAVSVSAQVNDTYVIPAVGNTAGGNGTRWATHFDVFNPQSYKLRVRVVFLPSGGTGDPQQIKFDAPANSNSFFPNVLDDLFDAGGTGALLVATFPEDNPGVPDDFLSRSFLVTTTTFNNASSGTYGQLVPGTWTGLQDFQTDQISAVVHGITNSSSTLTGFRTNVGAANLGRSSLTLKVSVYDADGNVIASKLPFTVPPQGHIQDRLPVIVERGSLEFFVDDPTHDGVVFPYASVIDNLSGDPLFEAPVLLADPKILFKGSAAAICPQLIGKRIDTALARSVAAGARDLGLRRVKSEG